MNARLLGGEQELTCEQIDKLMEVRANFKVPGKHPGCKKCEKNGTPQCREAQRLAKQAGTPDAALVAEITKKVLAAMGK